MEIFIEQTLPVYGTPARALIGALGFSALVLLSYLLIDKLPRPKKNKITPKAEPKYAKAMIGIVSMAMMFTAWDVWWHRAVGRDDFWIMPHIGLYTFTAIGIVLGFYVWRHCRDPLWKHIAFVLLFIPISGAFDNFWHAMYGVEDYSRAMMLAWSPPHVLLALAVIGTLTLSLRVLLKYRKTPEFNFFGNLVFGAITGIFLILLLPFYPTEGWGQVAGFAGAGIIALVYVASLLMTERTMRGNIDATFAMIFTLIFILTSYGKETGPINLMPHDRPPIWLVVFGFLAPAIILDLTKDRMPMWFRGLLASTVWSAILFGFSWRFFAPEFQYGLVEIFTAVAFSAVGGLVAASMFSLAHLDDEEHIEKLLKKW